MPLRIVNKNSTVQDRAPVAGDLEIGEIAVNANVNSPAAYIKDSAGNIVKLAGAGSVGDDWTRTGTALAPKTANDTIQFSAGTAALPGITPVGNATTGIYSSGANELAFATNATQRLLINSSGQILSTGLGTAANPALSFVGDTNTGIYSPGADQLAISTNGTGRLFVEDAGRLLLGYSSSVSTTSYNALSLSPFVQLHGTDQTRANFSVFNWGTGNNQPPNIILNRSISGTVGTRTALTGANTDLGAILFNGDDGTNFIPAALILAETDGTPGTDDMPGRLVFSTTADGDAAPTERLRIDSTGFVSLGGDTNTGFSNPSADNLAITTGGSERVRVDSSGSLLVGTSTARAVALLTPSLQIESTTGSGASLSLTRNANSGNPSFIVLGKSRGTANGDSTIVQSSDTLGEIRFAGADGVDLNSIAASISAQVDGTPGAGDMPGRLVFSTTADGASSPTERMRITSDAYVRLASGTGGIQFNGDTAAANALDDYEEGTFTPNWSFAGGGSAARFFFSGAYTKIGNTVYIRLGIGTSSISSPSGAATITGLPFSGASGAALGGLTISGYLKWKTDMPNLKAYVSGTSIVLNKSASTATALAPLEGSDFLNFANYNTIYIAGSYNVA